MSVEYIQRYWEALADETARWLGRFDAELLFACLFRSSQDNAINLSKNVHLPTLKWEPENKRQAFQSIEQLAQASDELTVQFENLLSSFIGPRLTSIMFNAAMEETNKSFEHALKR